MFNLNPASDWAPHFDPDPHEQNDEFSRIAKEAEYVDRHGFVPDQKKVLSKQHIRAYKHHGTPSKMLLKRPNVMECLGRFRA